MLTSEVGMRPKKPFPPGSAEVLKRALKAARSAAETKRLQAVLMRAISDSSPAEISAITGLSVATVRILHSTFLTKGLSGLQGPGRGGSRRRNLTEDEERAVLAPFVDPAKTGGVIVVRAIHEAYARAVGRSVSPSTVYRLLARHGWRKLTPRSRHPKQNGAAQEAFKKRSQGESTTKSRPQKPKASRSD
jgi:transposase